MKLDYSTLDTMRRTHPGWKLLLAESAPLVISFLYRSFIVSNSRTLSQADLIEGLEDELYALRQQIGPDAFPRRAQDYLNDWAANDRGWLRKLYPPGSEEPHFDLTPATEKTIAWLESFGPRAFVGTESRLLTIFDLLRQMVYGSETDPDVRIATLKERRREIDAEIQRITEGNLPMLDATAVKERFQQCAVLARELLSDFREVDHNFRNLDRQVRERITLWDGGKGALLDEIFSRRDAIADSDQGRSFRAFWDFLMSQTRQDELSSLLGRVLELPAVAASAPDKRFARVHYDWLDAGENTQRAVAQLSQQLRRFMDDRTYLENRRILEILRSIEVNAVAIRDSWPRGDFMSMDESSPTVDLPMERPLHSPVIKTFVMSDLAENTIETVDLSVLFSQVVVDKAKLAGNIRLALQQRSQITLSSLIEAHPLEHGLAELVGYLHLASETAKAMFDEQYDESITWQDPNGRCKVARLPRIIFVR